MNHYIPSMYCKSVFTIPYDRLKAKGIRCLIFDLDNTLALIDEGTCPKKVEQLLNQLKNDFSVVIISNNTNRRLRPYLDTLQIEGVAWALKPFTRGLRKIQKRHHLKKEEMVMIGDQLMTDVVAGNHFRIMTILVDPLSTKDLKITSINRYFERKKIERLSKQGILKRGNYYEQ